jgi:hypothetical protein
MGVLLEMVWKKNYHRNKVISVFIVLIEPYYTNLVNNEVQLTGMVSCGYASGSIPYYYYVYSK